MAPGHDSTDPFDVVFVCTGNRARSPLAEALFRKYAADVGATASSVGTLHAEGDLALPEAVEAARRLGVDLSAHSSRSIVAADLSRADLVLGFEPVHLSIAVVEAGASIGRTFLLGELVALLDLPKTQEDPRANARFAVSVADSRRIRSRPDPARAIADPYGASAKVMQATANEIDRLVRELAIGLFHGLR